MNSLKGSGGGHMKFLTFGTPLNKMKHPNVVYTRPHIKALNMIHASTTPIKTIMRDKFTSLCETNALALKWLTKR